jgi:NAD dependent epimerase/dehydratase family enzyme
VGSGNQYFSWIALDDTMDAIVHILATPTLVGPVNVTSPTPVTNREFAVTLGKVLGRPALVPVPAFALRLVFGTDGAAMVQSGQRVVPLRLLESGFRFCYDTLEPALRHLLGA